MVVLAIATSIDALAVGITFLNSVEMLITQRKIKNFVIFYKILYFM